MKPFWVSFYSYKGGVGRSMALANLAALLARRGRNVFMVDFDLEAPGLDSFQEFGVEARREGVVEYAYEFQKTRRAPELPPYVQECKFKSKVRGKVWLMSSGRKDEAYNAKRTELNWEKFYQEGVGEPFFDNWKAAVQRIYKPDYVFVDSRTGLTDVGGICTLQLPDLVVLLFGLNDQNLHGITAVLQTIRQAPSIKPPQVLPVATPVPNLPRDETGLLKTRFEEAEKLLGIKVETTLSYNTQAALVEKLFTLDSGLASIGVGTEVVERYSSRLASEYSALLYEVQQRDLNGLDSLIDKAKQACEDDEMEASERIREILVEDFSDRADALFAIGQIDKVFKGREEAIPSLQRALELEPGHAHALRAMVTHYKQKKQYDKVLELYDNLLDNPPELGRAELARLQHERAEHLMLLKRYPEGAQAFQDSLDSFKAGVNNLSLSNTFNSAEAQRRATGRVPLEAFKNVIELFEKEATIESHPLTDQANILQAMHIPYACVGNLARAKELLSKASLCANNVGKSETIFCVKTYTSLGVEEFMAVNREMLLALESNFLWDGMKLPVLSSHPSE